MSNCVIYNRVSSLSQNIYNRSVSLQAQEQICLKFAHENKLRVKSIYKEIHSAFNQKPKILSDLMKNKKQTIIISSIDRYSRNVEVGLKLAMDAFKNKNKIIFIQEQYVCGNHNDLNTLKRFLQISENESKTISNRIKKARNFLINNGMFAGGTIPYGCDVVEKKLVMNIHEQNVLEFIKTCMNDKVVCHELNKKMILITQKLPYEPINCYDKNGAKVDVITEQLTKQEIADLLNSYGVLKRGILWCPRVLKTAIKPHNQKVNSCESKLDDWYAKHELGGISMDEIKNPNDLGLNFDNIGVTNTLFKTVQQKIQPKLRRSARLNPCNVNNQLINNDSDTEMADDIYMFKQFTEFNKFKKLYKQ